MTAAFAAAGNAAVSIPAEIADRATPLTCDFLRRASETYGAHRLTPRQMCESHRPAAFEARARDDALALLAAHGIDPDAPAIPQHPAIQDTGAELRLALEAEIRRRRAVA